MLIEPHLYAVFGDPIAHSRSPEIHRAFAQQTDQDIMYTKQQVRVEDFVRSCDEFFALGGCGLNITLPLKELAFEYANQLTPRAELAGAVNTLKLIGSEKILGDNTDGCGIVTDMTRNLGWTIANKSVLILGAGGAVRGVMGPILEQDPSLVVVVNRTVAKAIQLATLFEDFGLVKAYGFADIPPLAFDIIINGTSMSLLGEAPPLSDANISAETCCYDMAYGEELTPFLQWAKNKGVNQLADGLGMLVEQAAESFYLWRGVRPETAPVKAMLREPKVEQDSA
jgi:shikimate dehydrogenase